MRANLPLTELDRSHLHDHFHRGQILQIILDDFFEASRLTTIDWGLLLNLRAKKSGRHDRSAAERKSSLAELRKSSNNRMSNRCNLFTIFKMEKNQRSGAQ